MAMDWAPVIMDINLLKKFFAINFANGLFGILPPAVGVGLANYFSRKSRAATGQVEEQFLGEDNEWLDSLLQGSYCKKNILIILFSVIVIFPLIFLSKKEAGISIWVIGFVIILMQYLMVIKLMLTSWLPEMENKIISK